MRTLLALPFLLVAVIAGCSLVGGGAEVWAVVELPSASPQVEVTVEADGRALGLSPSRVPNGISFSAEPLAVPPGPTALTCSVSRGSATTTVRTSIDAADGWAYTAWCAAAPADPTDGCFGCSTATAAGFAPSLGFAEDLRLWLYWTATDPDNPVDY